MIKYLQYSCIYNWIEQIKWPFKVYWLGIVVMSCDDKAADEVSFVWPEQDTTRYQVSDYYNSFKVEPPNWPVDNDLTVEGVLLGRMLFYDPILSRDSTVSCASCHRQQFAFSDPNQFSIGVGGAAGKRQSMALVNLGWVQNGYFWDGRSTLLRHQVLEPIQDQVEMSETLENVIEKLSGSALYKTQFGKAFGAESISIRNMSLAMEQFLISLISANAKIDQRERGEVEFTESEKRGKILFTTDLITRDNVGVVGGSHCGHCHGIKGTFSDNPEFMNNGLDDDASFTDFGRELESGDPADRARFRVPTMRNIAVTGPYMHDGRFQTLEEVLDHYNEQIKESSTASHDIIRSKGGLFLSDQDKTDIINFMKTLTDEEFLTDERFSSPF